MGYQCNQSDFQGIDVFENQYLRVSMMAETEMTMNIIIEKPGDTVNLNSGDRESVERLIKDAPREMSAADPPHAPLQILTAQFITRSTWEMTSFTRCRRVNHKF